jgi:hypothetical protein
MFYEAAISAWLSLGKQPNGMIVRLQGFDKGVFGGNFHTHNILHLTPGVDVVCYSNGPDYARGMRYAALQAAKGRVVMSVDSTHLLNLRNVNGNDDKWRMPFTAANEIMTFDQIRVHQPIASSAAPAQPKLAIVTYGNGVVTALQARTDLEAHGVSNVTVIDCPLLSAVPAELAAAVPGFDCVLFADVCKEGATPLSGHITKLQSDGLLPQKWRSVAAQNTYNPLGSTITFLSKEDIVWESLHLLKGPAFVEQHRARMAAERQL